MYIQCTVHEVQLAVYNCVVHEVHTTGGIGCTVHEWMVIILVLFPGKCWTWSTTLYFLLIGEIWSNVELINATVKLPSMLLSMLPSMLPY